MLLISSGIDRNNWKRLGHVAGFIYLLVIGCGLFAEVFVRQALKIPGDSLGTALRIRESEMLFRYGLMADLFNFVIGIPGALIMFILLKSVRPFLMMFAVALVIVQTAIIGANLLNQASPLLWLGNDAYLQSFSLSQRATFSMQSLGLHAIGYGIGLVFFGFYCVTVGYCLYHSGLLPRVIAVLYILAGVAYLANSCFLLLSKGFSHPFFPFFAVISFIGEMSLCLWLLIRSVRIVPKP